MKTLKQFVAESDDLGQMVLHAITTQNSFKAKRDKDGSYVYGTKLKLSDLFKNKWQLDKIGGAEGFKDIATQLVKTGKIEFDGTNVKVSKKLTKEINKVMAPERAAFKKDPVGFTKGT